MARSQVRTHSGEPNAAPGTLRPGGRTERCRRAVATAALTLLRRGETELSPARVAEEAGVARSTVYRRWPTRGDLLREAQTLHTRSLQAPNTGDLTRDVHGLALRLARFFSDPTEVAINIAMTTHVDSELVDWQITAWGETTKELTLPFTRAIERGELSSDTDVNSLVEVLVSPMLVRTVLMKEQLGKRSAQRLANQVLQIASCGNAQPAG